MELADLPDRFTIPFAASAGGGYVRPIPVASQQSITPGAASLTDGFPPLNFLPVGAGGVPPFGQDMNGILKQITQWSQWQGAGGLPTYDGTYASDIGGYPQGALIAGVLSGSWWLNLVDNNTSDPDAGGAGWIPLVTAVLPNAIFYVRTDGNNNNNGSANTAGSAFATIQGALDYIRRTFGAPGRRITIKMGIPGTYDIVNVGGFASGLTIEGDVGAQASYILAGANGMEVSSSGLVLKGLTLNPGGAGTFALQASAASFVSVEKVTFTGGSGSHFHILAGSGGLVNFVGLGAAIFSSSAAVALFATANGLISSSSSSGITFSGTPAFSTATAVASKCGVIDLVTPGFSIAGAATGVRYAVSLNAVINTGGGGANFFPGNSPGTATTQGLYV